MGMKKAGAVVASETAPWAEQPPIDNAHVAEGCEKFAEQPISLTVAAQLAGEAKQPESGATAAIERLSKPKAEAKPAYKARDYDAEALGKTRCVQFEAALMSPAIAGMRFDTMEQYLALVKQAADAGVAYSFQK